MTNEVRIARMQKTLRWLEEDSILLSARFKGLSKETHDSAKQFAAAVIDQARAELHSLLQGQANTARPKVANDSSEPPCEPAD